MNKELIDKIKTLYEKGQRDKALQILIDQLNEETELNNESYHKLINLSSKWIETEPTSEAHIIRGLIFYKLIDYSKAISDFNLSIEINPNYAKAYNNRGLTFYSLEEYQKAINDYSISIKIIPNDTKAYIARGNAYSKINEYKKAISDYKKAIDINHTNVSAYNSLGNAYSEIKEFQNAINNYNLAIKLDPKLSIAYYNRGITYSSIKEYKKAIGDFNKAIKLDLNYAKAYSNLGNVYSELNEYQKASVKNTKAIEIEPKKADSYYNRGISFNGLDEYEKALDDFNKHIEIGDTEYWIEQSHNNIKEIEEIQKNSVIKELNKHIDEIKDILLYEGNEITHYTGLTTSALLIGNKKSLFRLSESSFLNDTSEGQRLNKYMELKNGISLKTDAILFSGKPFIGSFVPGDKSNDLTLWRMYAKENQEEAKGCSLCINRNQFIDNIKREVINGDKESKLNDEDFNFYRVSYLKEDNTCIIPGANDKEDNLGKALIKLRKTVKKIIKKNEPELDKQVIERLNAIEYLFKDDAYFYESEIRLVMDGIGIEKKCSELNASPKVYIEIAPIRFALESITIGPKVERAEEWAALFHYQLNKDSKQETEIKLSQLPFK